MAKLAVAVLSLLLLGAWGWFANRAMTDWVTLYSTTSGVETTTLPGFEGLSLYVLGMHDSQARPLYDPRLPHYVDVPEPPISDGALPIVRIALGAVVSFVATLFYAVCVPSGSIFSINLACFVVFFTGTANMLFPLVLLARTAYSAISKFEFPYYVGAYGLLLYSVVALVACFTMLRNLGQMRSGKADATAAVVKCLLVTMVATAALAPTGETPGFALAGVHGLYWLAALCALSLLLIALTKENYRFD